MKLVALVPLTLMWGMSAAHAQTASQPQRGLAAPNSTPSARPPPDSSRSEPPMSGMPPRMITRANVGARSSDHTAMSPTMRQTTYQIMMPANAAMPPATTGRDGP
jgi:hypothetical protein